MSFPDKRGLVDGPGGYRGHHGGGSRGGQGQTGRGGLRGGDRGGPGRAGRSSGPGGGEGRARREREAREAAQRAKEARLAQEAAQARQRLQELAAAREAEQARQRLQELAAAREAERAREELKRLNEQRLAKEAAEAREELKRLNEQRLAKEAAEAREELERLNKQRLAKEAQEALVASGARTRKDTTTTPSALQERVTINRVLDQNPNIFGEDPDPTDYVLQDEGGLSVLRDANTKQRIGSVGEFGDMLPGPMSAIGSLFLDPKTTTFTVDPLFARQDQFGALTGGVGSLERRMGGGDGPRQQTTAPPLLPSGEPLEKKEEEEKILSGFTGDARGAGSQFASSLPVSGITRLPAATNYMDYLKSAFTPVNLASPFGGAFSSNPIYRAAQGGFIGFMDEPLNIMYPSNGNMVVHDGISGILKKYKEIRSEL
jgi:multidrug efflux pump subunit AcrA (membrane-fusion protein)